MSDYKIIGQELNRRSYVLWQWGSIDVFSCRGIDDPFRSDWNTWAEEYEDTNPVVHVSQEKVFDTYTQVQPRTSAMLHLVLYSYMLAGFVCL